MSGGVDSSVAAGLVAEAGYRAFGLTMLLYDSPASSAGSRSCCAGQDIYDARRVADRLGIPHYVLDYRERFRTAVMEDFADAYRRGETPIPCVRCNERVKFRDLLSAARDLGADALVTGHYVRRVETPAGCALHRAFDGARDQSYFLFATTRAQLECLRFPLGGLPKACVREEAARLGLAVAEKPDSQDICFVGEGGYARTVERLRPGAAEPGPIVDLAGRVLGRHEGVIRYTVGQRRGLGIASSEPLYVVSVDAAGRRVTVGPRAALLRDIVVTGRLNWLDGAPLRAGEARAVTARLRSSHPGAPARIALLPGGRARVALDEPEPATAPGQACVLYDGDRLLGGGWIRETRRSPALDAPPDAVAAASA